MAVDAEGKNGKIAREKHTEREKNIYGGTTKINPRSTFELTERRACIVIVVHCSTGYTDIEWFPPLSYQYHSRYWLTVGDVCGASIVWPRFRRFSIVRSVPCLSISKFAVSWTGQCDRSSQLAVTIIEYIIQARAPHRDRTVHMGPRTIDKDRKLGLSPVSDIRTGRPPDIIW